MAREEQPGGRGREQREQPHSEQDRPYSEQARPAQLTHAVRGREHGHPEGRVQARVRVVVHEEVAQGGPGQQQRRPGPGRQHRGEGPERAGLLAEIAVTEVAIMTVSKNFFFTGGCNHDHVKTLFYLYCF